MLPSEDEPFDNWHQGGHPVLVQSLNRQKEKAYRVIC